MTGARVNPVTSDEEDNSSILHSQYGIPCTVFLCPLITEDGIKAQREKIYGYDTRTENVRLRMVMKMEVAVDEAFKQMKTEVKQMQRSSFHFYPDQH